MYLKGLINYVKTGMMKKSCEMFYRAGAAADGVCYRTREEGKSNLWI